MSDNFMFGWLELASASILQTFSFSAAAKLQADTSNGMAMKNSLFIMVLIQTKLLQLLEMPLMRNGRHRRLIIQILLNHILKLCKNFSPLSLRLRAAE